MARVATRFRCRSCAAVVRRWAGRCPGCGEWNSLTEDRSAPTRSAQGRPGAAAPVLRLAEVDPSGGVPRPTGLGELDRVLSGGLLPGSVTLAYGEPGVGKSTLLLQALMSVAGRGGTALLVSAEESASQVRARAERLGDLSDGLMVAATGDLHQVAEAVASLGPDLVVVDSVQTVTDPETAGSAGSLAQVRACAERLARLAEDHGTPIVLVGHVTKDGGLAGPRALEHLVDTVVAVEGDRHHALRLLRTVKHRFGPTGEVGLLQMGDRGFADVPDPGPLLLGDRRPDVPGSTVTPLVQGRRPLLVELQALVYEGHGTGAPRRTVQGVDPQRLAMLLAVLECRAGLPLGGQEVFVSATGGIRATEPSADLAMALAVASSVVGEPLPPDLLSFGEVGLAGEVRQVPSPEQRLGEAARLGFTRALVPAGTPDGRWPMTLVRVRSVAEAVAAAYRHRATAAGRPAELDRAVVAPGPAGTMLAWSTSAASR